MKEFCLTFLFATVIALALVGCDDTRDLPEPKSSLSYEAKTAPADDAILEMDVMTDATEAPRIDNAYVRL